MINNSDVDIIISEIYKENCNIHIFGFGGIGKTTLITRICKEIHSNNKRSVKEGKKIFVPIIVPCSELDKDNNGRNCITNYIVKNYSFNRKETDIEVLCNRVTQELFNNKSGFYHYVLFLDGLNEYFMPDLLQNEINKLSRLINISVITSSRNDYEWLIGFQKYRINPIDYETLKNILPDVDESLYPLLSIPFYLNMFRTVSDESRKTIKDDYHLISNFILDTKNKITTSNSYINTSKKTFLDETNDLLDIIIPNIAYDNVLSFNNKISTSEFNSYSEKHGYADSTELLYIVNCFGFFSQTGNYLLWSHQIYRDYFAAKYLNKDEISIDKILNSFSKPEIAEILDLYYNSFTDKAEFEKNLIRINNAVSKSFEFRSDCILNKNIVYLFGKISTILRNIDFSKRDLSLSNFDSFTKIINCDFSFSKISHISFPYLKEGLPVDKKEEGPFIARGKETKKYEFINGKILLINYGNELIHINLQDGFFSKTFSSNKIVSNEFGNLGDHYFYLIESSPYYNYFLQDDTDVKQSCFVSIYDLNKYSRMQGAAPYPQPEKCKKLPFKSEDIIRTFAKDGIIYISTTEKDYYYNVCRDKILETKTVYKGRRYIPLYSKRELLFSLFDSKMSKTTINICDESSNEAILVERNNAYVVLDPVLLLSDYPEVFNQLFSINEFYQIYGTYFNVKMSNLDNTGWGTDTFFGLSTKTETGEEAIIIDIYHVPNSDVSYVLYFKFDNKNDFKKTSNFSSGDLFRKKINGKYISDISHSNIKYGKIDLYTKLITELQINDSIIFGFVRNEGSRPPSIEDAIRIIENNVSSEYIKDYYLFLFGPNSIYSYDLINGYIKEVIKTNQKIISAVTDEYGMTVITESEILHFSVISRDKILIDNDKAVNHKNDSGANNIVNPANHYMWKLNTSQLMIQPVFFGGKPFYKVFNKEKSYDNIQWVYNARTKEIITCREKQDVLFVKDREKTYSLINNYVYEIDSRLLKKTPLFKIGVNDLVCGTFIHNTSVRFLVCEQELVQQHILKRCFCWISKSGNDWIKTIISNDLIDKYDHFLPLKGSSNVQSAKDGNNVFVCFMKDGWFYAFDDTGKYFYKDCLGPIKGSELLLFESLNDIFLIPNENVISYDHIDYFYSIIEKSIYRYSFKLGRLQVIRNDDIRSKIYYLHNGRRFVSVCRTPTSYDIFETFFQNEKIRKGKLICSLPQQFIDIFLDENGSLTFILKDSRHPDILVEAGIAAQNVTYGDFVNIKKIGPFSHQMTGTHIKGMRINREMLCNDVDLLKEYGAID